MESFDDYSHALMTAQEAVRFLARTEEENKESAIEYVIMNWRELSDLQREMAYCYLLGQVTELID